VAPKAAKWARFGPVLTACGAKKVAYPNFQIVSEEEFSEVESLHLTSQNAGVVHPSCLTLGSWATFDVPCVAPRYSPAYSQGSYHWGRGCGRLGGVSAALRACPRVVGIR
jgi:hypothetical protein